MEKQILRIRVNAVSISDIQSRTEQLNSLIRDVLSSNFPPGFALGVVHQGRPAFEYLHGVAELEQGIPITSNTVFRIGSISKIFTAIAVLQLLEHNKLKLDDPVNQHLKFFAVHPPVSDAPEITIHHLLSHTSGLGRGETLREFIDVYGHFTGRWDTRFSSLNAFYGPEGLHPTVPAGEKYSYANNGYAVLGQVIEDVSGQTYVEYIRQHIFRPLGMLHSDVVLSDDVRQWLARGYRSANGRFIAIRPTEIRQQGAGSLLASLNDMMSFTAAMIQRDARLLRQNTWKILLQAHWQLDPRLTAQAYGIEFRVWDEYLIYQQSGGAGGFNANMIFCPDQQTGIVALSNRHLTTETIAITRHLMRHLLNIPAPETEQKRMQQQRKLSSHKLERFIGYYAPSPGWKTNIDFYTDVGFAGVHIEVDGGALNMRSDFGLLARGKKLYSDDTDPKLFYIRFSDWYPVIFRSGVVGEIDSIFMDTHFHLHRQSVTRSIRFRLRRFLIFLFSLFGLLHLLRRRRQ